MSKEKSVLRDRSFAFALRCIKVYKRLAENKEFILSKQLLRSGTSVGANIREAQNAESRPDFIHKFGIAQKECDETIYWLELLNQSGFLNDIEFKVLHTDCNEILKMLRSSILTLKQRNGER